MSLTCPLATWRCPQKQCDCGDRGDLHTSGSGIKHQEISTVIGYVQFWPNRNKQRRGAQDRADSLLTTVNGSSAEVVRSSR